MKTFFKTALFLIFSLALGMNTVLAQDPSFIVAWNPCEVQVTGSNYYVQYSIYDVEQQSFVVNPTWYGQHFSQYLSSGTIQLDFWDCNQNVEKPVYYLFIYVVLRKDGVDYCTGSARSDLLTCYELYNNTTTLTVNMVY